VSPRLPFYIHEQDPPAKRQIVRAAMKLFSERGLAATSIRDIAGESGYTNPALYKHFAGKEEMALQLFEACHRHVFTSCAEAIDSAESAEAKVGAYVGRWLELVDQHPDVLAFLDDSARVLWPRTSATVRRQTLIGLARSLVVAPRRRPGGRPAPNPDLAAAALQGTLTELARMIQVGVVPGPATRYKDELVALARRLVA
jgi:AcrR family transcriptional regulator